MNKSGIAFWYLIEIIGGVFAAILVTSVALQAGTGELFAKSKLARDSALLIDTLSVVPGNSALVYPANLSTHLWSVAIRENTVTVRSPNEQLSPEKDYDTVQDIQYETKDEDILSFVKNGNAMVWAREPLTKFSCPQLNLQKEHPKIFFDVIGGGEKKAIARRTALAVRASGKFAIDSSSSLEFDEQTDAAERVERALLSKPDAIIGLAMGEQGKSVAYINGNQRNAGLSAALACFLVNEIPGEQRAIVPLIDIPEQFKTLEGNTVGVFLELGSEDAAAIAAGLEQGIAKYHE